MKGVIARHEVPKQSRFKIASSGFALLAMTINNMYRVNFSFSKTGLMRYISHLDLMRLFMRAMRRADLPLKLSEGFSPHPKLSFKRALKLGVESEREEASIVLRFPVPCVDFKDRLQKQLPEGIEVKDVQGNFN